MDVVLWIHVDRQGQVIDVRDIHPEERYVDEKDLDVSAVRSAALNLRYVPFTRNGVPLDAWVQETLALHVSEVKAERTVPFPKLENPRAVSIQLWRSGCYGTCPSYTVAIRGDGEVSYSGGSYVSIPGTHASRVSISEVTTLLDQFRTANFLGLKDSYRAGVTDCPTYRLSLSLGGNAKVVEDYVGESVGMPASVTELEDAVDRAADSARWVSSSPGTLQAMRQAGIGIKSVQATQILRTAVYGGDMVTVSELIAAGTPISLPQPPASLAPLQRLSSASLSELAVESEQGAARLDMLKTVLGAAGVRTDRAGMQRALARAAESGSVGLAKVLIDAGADPSARFTGRYAEQDRNQTYLMLAAASGVWAMLDDALARPHDIHAVDADGRTALVNMVYNAPPMEYIFPLVDRLLGAGASRAELDRVLLDTCQPSWIPGLIARFGNVNARDAKGNAPLFQPCTVEGIQALLDAGADPTLRNYAGQTAVEAAFPPENGREDSRAAIIRRFSEMHPSQKLP